MEGLKTDIIKITNIEQNLSNLKVNDDLATKRLTKLEQQVEGDIKSLAKLMEMNQTALGDDKGTEEKDRQTEVATRIQTVELAVTQVETSTTELLTSLKKFDKESNRIDDINNILHTIIEAFSYSSSNYKIFHGNIKGTGALILRNFSEHLHNGRDKNYCKLSP